MTVSKLRKILDKYEPSAKVFITAVGIGDPIPGTYNVKEEDTCGGLYADDTLILEAKFKIPKAK